MRIVAGRLGGRRLLAPKGMATRPTTERVREALFAILGDLTGSTVLDCFAGSGALGLEALSRGAKRVILVESAAPACGVIRRNIESLAVAHEVELLPLPLERSRNALRERGPYDLVLSDPPWPIAQAAAERVGSLLAAQLGPGGQLVLGHPARAPVELPSELELERVDLRRWGDSGMSFFRARVR